MRLRTLPLVDHYCRARADLRALHLDLSFSPERCALLGLPFPLGPRDLDRLALALGAVVLQELAREVGGGPTVH
jgi:hypothetical protein